MNGIPISLLPGGLNIPKFLEFELQATEGGNSTDYFTTVLNEDQDYITWSSWWDELIVTGIIPLSALVVFNLRIYLKLRASDRQKYRFVGRKSPLNSANATTTTSNECASHSIHAHAHAHAHSRAGSSISRGHSVGARASSALEIQKDFNTDFG